MKLFSVLLLSLTTALGSVVLHAADAAKAPDTASAKNYVQVTEWTKVEGVRYTLADAELTIEIADPKAADGVDPFVTGKKEHVTLDAAAATATWAKVTKLGIPKWRGIYDASDSGQEDSGGTEWSVDYRSGSDKKQSHGVNAFPALNPIGMIQLGNGGNAPDAASAFSELVVAIKSAHANS